MSAPAPHIMPLKALVVVWICLLFLLAATVAVSNFNFSRFAIHIALAIALVKALLVAMYFMGLRYDHFFHTLVFIAALIFMAILLNATVSDSEHYQYKIYGGPGPGDYAAPGVTPSRDLPPALLPEGQRHPPSP
jgi:cytochrome c oxidase subunit 4